MNAFTPSFSYARYLYPRLAASLTVLEYVQGLIRLPRMVNSFQNISSGQFTDFPGGAQPSDRSSTLCPGQSLLQSMGKGKHSMMESNQNCSKSFSFSSDHNSPGITILNTVSRKIMKQSFNIQHHSAISFLESGWTGLLAISLSQQWCTWPI